MLLIVSYDLITPGRNYAKLYNSLESSQNYARILESVWIISVDMTAEQTRDYLLQFIDKNDRLIVTPYSKEIFWYNLDQSVVDWLSRQQ